MKPEFEWIEVGIPFWKNKKSTLGKHRSDRIRRLKWRMGELWPKRKI